MIDYNFFQAVEMAMKYVIYGDSVSKDTKTLILINNEIYYRTFDSIWNWLIESGSQIQLQNNKEYIFIKNEFKVATYSETLDLIEFIVPEYLMRHKINKTICRLNLTKHNHLDVTNDHSLLHYDGEKLIKTKPQDCQYVPVIRNQFSITDDINAVYFTFGLWFADGSFPNEDHYPSISSQYYNEISDYIHSLDSTFKSYIRKTGKKNDFQFNFKPVRQLLLENNLKAVKSTNRVLSESLFIEFKTNKSKFISFFAGYYVGDGSFNNNAITVSSSNLQWMEQLQELLMCYGLYSHILISKNGRHYKETIFGDMYKLMILSIPYSIYKLLKQYDCFKTNDITYNSLNYGKNENSIGHKNKGIIRGFEHCKLHNIKPVKVQSHEQIEYNDYVYDFSISENQNFIANGILVHNTDSLYINIPGLIPKTPDEALQHAEEIGYEINQQITHFTENFLLPKMGIDPKYNETLFKTELVCDGMLLLPVKKNYAYSLLAIEGSIMEKQTIEYTGIVKKSDIPPLTKQFIKDMIEKVIFNKELRGKNLVAEINNLAIEYNTKLNNLIDNLELLPFATPKKWGSGHNKDRTPWQIIAMQLYNTIMDEHVFSPMSAGMIVPIQIAQPIDFETKIAAFRNKHKRYIGDTPINNLTKLAVPYTYDVNRLVQALNYYGIVIDKDACWGLVLNKVSMHIIETVKKHNG